MPRALLLAALAAAERVTEFAVPAHLSVADVKHGLVSGKLHEANKYGPVRTTPKKGGFLNEFKHPRGGRTVERCTITKDAPDCFEMTVEAESPTAPFGDRFQTVVHVEVRRGLLKTRSRVRWLPSRRPAAFLTTRVESAAERGSSEAYGKLVSWLDERPAERRFPGARLLGAVRPRRLAVVAGALFLRRRQRRGD
mmetsp:Transcript_8169/g.24471  ORF Transcript_8169/g.24471 Transcript_8169/m.24471 type:complete len:195 (+) Transcript_8169:190-774(+)